MTYKFRYPKEKVLLILTGGLFLVIISAVFLIFYLDNGKISINQPKEAYPGYNSLAKDISSLSNQPDIVSSNYYNRSKVKLAQLNSKTMTEQEKYKELMRAGIFLFALYSDTNNPKLFKIINDLNNFAKRNFPSLYKEKDFLSGCVDPTCSDNPQPPEILNLIEEIKTTNLPQEEKKTLMREILNVGYLPKKNIETRGNSYLIMADITSGYFESTKSAYSKIPKKFYEFIEKNYPDQYKNYLNNTSTDAYVGKFGELLKLDETNQ